MTMRRKSSRDEIVKKDVISTDSSSSCFFSKLPVEIITEIFFKLLIKDVMRCKCVCTSWYNLLSNPNFSQNYAKNSIFTSILHCTDPVCIDPSSHVSCLLEISDNNMDCYISAPFNLSKSPCLSGLLNGSCNGFLCMTVNRHGAEVVYVTNPITGDSIALPELKIVVDGYSTCTLGYSPTSNEFKVVRIGFRYLDGGDIEESEIISVGVDDTWRRLPDSFTDLPFLYVVVEFDGAFHWIPKDENLGSISTFDLTEEKNGQISAPPGLVPVSRQMELGVLANQLALVDHSVASQISIWKMKKYGVMESWTKVVVLTSWFAPAPRWDLIPVAELQNGDMLFSDPTNYLVSCNIEQKKCSKFEFHGVGKLTSKYMFTFTPNFTSLAEWTIKGDGNTVKVESD